MTYGLITVTNAGLVSYAKGFATKQAAEEARSIAMFGRTIAGQAEWRAAESERFAKLAAAGMTTWMCGVPDRSGEIKWAHIVIDVEDSP